jgi:poly(ADP-ribose) glycohydrolase ARH3
MAALDIRSKFLGCMLGSAIGDAVGELAFRYPQKELLYSQVKQLHQLRYTDDTAMAIGIAESIIETKGIDQEDLGNRFRCNFNREPWRGYASGPPTVFSIKMQLGLTYSQAAQRLFNGTGSLGNGAAMRVAPVGLIFHHSPHLYEQACETAQVTHAHPVGMDGAAIQALCVAQAVRLDSGDQFQVKGFIKGLMETARTKEIGNKLRLVSQLLGEDVAPGEAIVQLGRTVAVQESMPFSLYSFLRHPKSFEECLFCAVLHGGDRDTLGAMACAISGAYLGIEAIPLSWRDKLENRTYLESLAVTLAGMLAT